MKVEAPVLTALLFVAAGASAGLVVKSGVFYVPVLTEMARNSRPDSTASHVWPPRANEPYPDIDLVGLDGKPVRLSDYRGKVMLIEPISMSCKACQSFSGANEEGRGPFGGGAAQAGLESLNTYARQFAHVSFGDPNLVYVQVLFYDLSARRPPSLDEARAWAKHFGLDQPNVLVTVASSRYVSKETRAMIPGFHLVDREGLLQGDAGKPPRQDLYSELLPRLKQLLENTNPTATSEDAPRIEPENRARVQRPAVTAGEAT